MLFKSAIISEVLRNRDTWESNVVVGAETECAKKGSMMTATGVPPQIYVIREVLNLMQAVTDLPQRMMLNFGQLLDERAGQVGGEAVDNCAVERPVVVDKKGGRGEKREERKRREGERDCAPRGARISLDRGNASAASDKRCERSE